MILVLKVEENLVIFGKVHSIFIVNEEITLLELPYKNLGFDENFYAY